MFEEYYRNVRLVTGMFPELHEFDGYYYRNMTGILSMLQECSLYYRNVTECSPCYRKVLHVTEIVCYRNVPQFTGVLQDSYSYACYITGMWRTCS